MSKPTVRVIPYVLADGPPSKIAEELEQLIQSRLDDGWTLRGFLDGGGSRYDKLNVAMAYAIYVKKVKG